MMSRTLFIALFGLLLIGCGGDEGIDGIVVLGGTITQLTQDRGTDPDWSPDGSEIIFIKSQNLWLISAEGGDPVQITSLPGQELNPRWSPVSGVRQVVFANKPDADNFKIFTLNLDGGDPVEIYHSTKSLSYPSFTHDGSQVVFTTTMADRGVMVIPAEGGEATEIPHQDGWQGRIHCVHASPVEPTICYAIEQTPEYYAMTIPLEGGAPTNWAHVTEDVQTRNTITYAVYNKSGTKLALLVRGQIMWTDAPGKDLVQLTNRRQDGYFEYLSWSPEDNRIVSYHVDNLWILDF
jgi:Tol biopolymer transport system component